MPAPTGDESDLVRVQIVATVNNVSLNVDLAVERAGRALERVERTALLEALRDLAQLHARRAPISASSARVRDPARLDQIAASWRSRYGDPIDAPDLAGRASAHGARREQAHALVCDELGRVQTACERAGRVLEQHARAAAGTALDLEVRHAVGVLRDLAARAARAHGGDVDATRRRLHRTAWTEQRDAAAVAVYEWCRARSESDWGLVREVVRALWWHGWDVDPANKRDREAIKKAVQRTRKRRRRR